MWGKVKNLAHFDIDIFKLANKQYEYQYHLDKNFFLHFDNSPVEKADLNAKILLDKQDNLITVSFDIEGTVELECDRSLEKFDHPMKIQERMIYQYGEEEQELSDDIVIITNNTQSISVAHLLYEFVGLSVPMRKLHPKYAEEDNPFVEGEIIFSSSTAQQTGQENEDESEEPTDPRWSVLKNLKNLN